MAQRTDTSAEAECVWTAVWRTMSPARKWAMQQWSDVLGVMRVQGGRLDETYLDHWAADLQVSDLLERARQEIAGG